MVSINVYSVEFGVYQVFDDVINMKINWMCLGLSGSVCIWICLILSEFVWVCLSGDNKGHQRSPLRITA